MSDLKAELCEARELAALLGRISLAFAKLAGHKTVEPLFTVTEVADRVRLKRRTILAKIQRREITPVYAVSPREILVPQSALLAFLDRVNLHKEMKLSKLGNSRAQRCS